MRLFSGSSDGLSLSSRLKPLTVLWVGSAFLSITFTLLLSWRLGNAARAIGDAGSLEMQVHRLTYVASVHTPSAQIDNQIKEFERTLANVTRNDVIHPLISSQMPLAYDLTQSMLLIDWESDIKSSLQHYKRSTQIGLYRFAGNIELFLQAMENANEQDTLWLHRPQMAVMLVILVATGLMVVRHYSWIIRPLEKLHDGVETISGGRFGIQIDTDQIREFAQVSKGFNQMNRRSKTLCTDLEGQVAQQTQDLAWQNRDLTLLYQTTRNLHQTFTPQQTTEEFLVQILPAFSTLGSAVCPFDEEREHSDLATNVGKTEGGNRVEFLIVYRSEQPGVLALHFLDGQMPNEQGEELLQTLSGQLGISIANSHMEQERHLFAVLRGHNLIAQGLHDSIAQALTFLNLQMQMLESAFTSNQHEQAEGNISFIKDGVREYYEDVRGLLMDFRTEVSNKDFPEAIESLLTRFERQTGTPTDLKWQDNGQALNHDKHLQIVFISQGSLSNIREHVRAQHISIEIANHGDFVMRIQDDGAGFNQEYSSNRPSDKHVGLGIIQERVQRINTKLTITSQIGQGAVVILTLPQQMRIAP